MMKPACGARTRNSGQPCRAAPMPTGRCRLHGGASPPPGPTHPNYRHGRYSKALDNNPIAALYELNRTDPRLLRLREDIALLIARKQHVLEGLHTGESADAWRTLREMVAAAHDAVARGCAAAVTEFRR